MRATSIALAALCVAAPLAAQESGCCATGWEGRLDRSSMSMDDIWFRDMGSGVHATMGSGAGIFWKDSGAMASGAYTVSATFKQMTATAHPEAYGLFIGGSDLEGDGVSYTYFLVRQGGQFLIKKRDGGDTSDIVGWTPSDAVNKAAADGTITNTLAVRVEGGTVHFLANGTEVHSIPASRIQTDGIAGLRVNHRLDLHIGGFQIEK